MKKVIFGFLSFVLCVGVIRAAQDSTLSQREVRDPRKLEAILEANAADAQTRLAALESLVQYDTNDTTTVTSYSAPQVNSLLVGKDGGTSVVWIATATGTNGWVKAIEN